MRKCLLALVFTACLLLCIGTAPALAQVTTGTIFGTVTDESQGVMPGVTVTITNVDTGITRALVTDDGGRYRAPSLPLGSYEIRAELSGFQTAVRSGVTLTVGREAAVDFTLKIGDLTERVEVTDEAPLINTTSSELADLVDQQQIRDLPLNGRSYTQLALLQPGVIATTRTAGFTTLSGGGVTLSVSGARPMNTAFYLDGTDIKDAFGRTPGSAAGTNLGVDTIREFQVLVNSFSAEFGGAGGVINSVTKSGTNELRGSAFYFQRNSAFDARNFFDGDEPPPFRRDQTGVTFGGPLKHNKAFFFGSYEGLRERLTTTNIINVPGAELKAGITPTGTVTVNPVIQKYLNSMPLPNGRLFANGTGEYISERERPIDEQYFMGKVDYQISDRFLVFGRYTYDSAKRVDPLPFPQFTLPAETRYQYLTIEQNSIVSPTLLNTARFGVTRSRGLQRNEVDGLDESYNLIPLPGRIPPQLSVPTLAAWGNDGINDRTSILTTYQFGEKLAWTRGQHALVAGVEMQHILLDGFSASRIHGRLRFESMNEFLQGQPSTWEFLVPGTGEMRYFRQNQFSFYLQDDWRVRPNLTLNVGLRGEFVTVPTEVEGRISNLRDPLDPAATVGNPFFEPSNNNFGPRVGLVWDPKGDGKMSIRSGFGVFHQAMTHGVWNIPAMQNEPFFVRAIVDRPAFPPSFDIDPSALPPSNPTPLQFDADTPTTTQYNLTVQRQLAADTVVAVSYVGSRGRNLPSAMNPNVANFEILPDGRKFWPVGATRINPAFGPISLRAFNARSSYNSFQARLNKRFSEGLQVQSSYTYGKTLDNTSETQGGVALSDAFNPDIDYSLSDMDVRHNWVLNYTYALPFFQDGNGTWAGRVLGGWQMSGILTMTSGFPTTVSVGFNRSRDLNTVIGAGVERPDLVPGASSSPVLGGPDGYTDAASFSLQEAGTHGNLGRNTLIGPGLTTFDLSLVKLVPFGRDRDVQFRAEFFNLFNRANFANPDGVVFSNASGSPNPTFGRITATASTARQIQLALKVRF